MTLDKTLDISTGSAYKHGWRLLWPHFWMLLLILIIYYAISSIVGYLPQIALYLGLFESFYYDTLSVPSMAAIWGIAGAMIVISLFGLYPMMYGLYYAFLKAARDEKVRVADLFEPFKNYWNVVGNFILVSLIYTVGIILLVIPGIYLACKLVFTPFLVVDKRMGAVEAIKESWKMTDGCGWNVFLIVLLGIPISIAGMICLGVGVIIAGMWIYMAIASLYYMVSLKTEGEMYSVDVENVSPYNSAY